MSRDLYGVCIYQVEFDYHDDAVNEVVQLGKKRDTSAPLTHTYVFDDYGEYDVWATVRNNISRVVVGAVVQVGEDIDYVDVYGDRQRAAVGEPVTFTVQVPRGSPVRLQIDLGDGGDNRVVYLPAVSEARWFSERAKDAGEEEEGGGNAVGEEKGMVAAGTGDGAGEAGEAGTGGGEKGASDEGGSVQQEETADQDSETNEAPAGEPARRKRAAQQPGGEAGNGTAVVTEAAAASDDEVVTVAEVEADDEPAADDPAEAAVVTNKANEPFTITHRYKKPGVYFVNVTVSNQFGVRRSHFCPQLVVVAKEALEPRCSEVAVAIADAATETNPTEVYRSASIALVTSSTLQCDDGLRYEARYSWRAERRTADGRWRPELGVCQTESADSTMRVPSHTLWYGLYRLTAVALVHARPAGEAVAAGSASVVSSPPAVTYVRVTRSPLVARIAGKPHVDISRFWPLTVDVSGSHDPDVEHDNTTGFVFHLFGYAKRLADELDDAPLEDLLVGALLVANSSDDAFRIYGVGPCFVDTSNIWALRYEMVIKADHLLQDDAIVFRLVVTKDDRVATVSQEVKVWPTNNTGNNVAAIGDLLASGNVAAALMAMSSVTDGLNANNQVRDGVGTARMIIRSATYFLGVADF